MNDEDIQLSRRKILAGLGTIGVASAGAGLGTTAWLSDEESFLNNVLTAGTLDLSVDYRYLVWQGAATDDDDYGSGTNNGGLVTEGDGPGGEAISFDIDDVKPGDCGHFQFCFDIVDNPAYLWACGTVTENAENGYTEPEPVDENGEGELDDAIQAVAYYCPEPVEDGVGVLDTGPEVAGEGDVEEMATPMVIAHGSLGEVVEDLTYGVPLDGNPFEPGRQPFRSASQEDDERPNPCVCISWYIPTEVGNEIQGDSLTVDLTFNAVQSRHNDGDANPCCDCAEDEVALAVDGEVYCVTPFTGASVADWYDFGSYVSGNDAIQADDTATVTLFREDGGDLYLVVVNDDRDSSGGGAADYTITGLSGGQSWAVEDDGDSGNADDYSVAGGTATGQWQWSANHTDGGALGALGSTFDVTVDMLFNDAASGTPLAPGTIDTVRVVGDDGSGGVSTVWSDAVGEDDAASVNLRSQCVGVEPTTPVLE